MLKKYLIQIVIIQIIISSIVGYLSWNHARSYYFDIGVEKAGQFIIAELLEISRSANKECHVAAIPMVTKQRDTVVYFITPKMCNLDSLISKNWKRNDSFN